MKSGLEVFLSKDLKNYRNERLGFLCNQASVDNKLVHLSDLVLEKKHKLNVTAFFGPQHGIRGEKQDNMIESEDFVDPRTKLPVFSLYSHTRVPTDHMMGLIDTLFIDLQDVGTRIYTFMYTMANCMQRAAALGKKIVVLDRPNPIGCQQIEGHLLLPNYASFVGQYPMIVRHGMTLGELATFFNEEFGIGCDLTVIRYRGVNRKDYADSWKRAWVAPSPNMPCLEAAMVFPGMVLFEGTNVSEGRGTTKPFEWIGAPFIDADALAHAMNKKKIPGVYFRPIFFQPTYQKCAGQVCGGVQVHVTNRKQFPAYWAGVELLVEIATRYPAQFEWKQPPYEYEYHRMPIDLIAGSTELREVVEGKLKLSQYKKKAESDTQIFKKLRKDFLLYD